MRSKRAQPATASVILLGVVVPSLMVILVQTTAPRVSGVELPPADVELLQRRVAEQQLALQRLERERFFMYLAICSAIGGAGIGFIVLTLRSSPVKGRDDRFDGRKVERSA